MVGLGLSELEVDMKAVRGMDGVVRDFVGGLEWMLRIN